MRTYVNTPSKRSAKWSRLCGVVCDRERSEEVPMPWMPEAFSNPIAETLPTQEGRELESANDAIPYYEGIMAAIPEARWCAPWPHGSPSWTIPASATWRVPGGCAPSP